MSRVRPSAKALRYAVCGVLAVGLLTGCAGSSHLARAGDHAIRSSAKLDRAVDAAEAAVQQSPRDVAARSALGEAYLAAGRFHAAATSFADAIKLGDTSGRAQLSLALAEIGAGDCRAALAVLDEAGEAIPATDRGLAVALAGDPVRGVAILTGALRAGENTPKLRQNLAYAFALGGRWREARIAMAQDVPADQISDRISKWAMMAQPGDLQKRIATLLDVPFGVQDAGQPEALALGDAPQAGQLAAAEPAAPVAPAAGAELPPVDEPAVAAAPPAVAASTEMPAPVMPVSAGVASAAAATEPGFVSHPVIQAIAAPAPARGERVAAVSHRRAAPTGTHLVQLGSFSSEANAQHAWRVFTARNPALRNYRMTITPAVVNGRNYWRVAAGGLDGSTALRICSGVRNRGGGCLAYAAANPPAGAKPELAFAGGGLAKARR